MAKEWKKEKEVKIGRKKRRERLEERKIRKECMKRKAGMSVREKKRERGRKRKSDS